MAGVVGLMKSVVARLTDVLTVEGFVVSEPLDGLGSAGPSGQKNPSWVRVWFVAPDSGVPGMIKAVQATVQRDGHGGVVISAHATIVSSVLEGVLEGMSADVLAKGGRDRNDLASVNFGYFERPLDPREIPVGGEGGIDYAMGKFVKILRGPVADWFVGFDSPAGLLAAARVSATMADWDRVNPDPVVLRAAVVLSVVNGAVRDAADLMGWYLDRGGFHKWDSFDRVSGFDAAMAARFPEYARLRG